jgi:asparagine synthase (glutamine-hydrolysing)
MCGFCGFLINKNFTDLNNSKILSMTNETRHRGPDNTGTYSDEFISLGHNRLSILDLSASANQPIESFSKRFVLVFNGEIYNHNELRHLIKNEHSFSKWSSNSDTQTLVNLFEFYDIEKTLNLLNGMFAFALWDKREKNLHLARDRFGQKPLYYGWSDDNFLFGSELKNLKKFSKIRPEINLQAIQLFSKLHYIPSPITIYKNIFKLEPGTYIKINYSNKVKYSIKKDINIKESLFQKTKWFKKKEINQDIFNLPLEKKLLILEEKLINAVSSQLLSDVPLGTFLSGGIDSSLILALMNKVSNDKIKTFSIGFDSKTHDESFKAKKLAKILNTDHYEYILKREDVLFLGDKINKIFDEPFSDSSQIPTIILSRETAKKVKVALTGDCGDELFGGYIRHITFERIKKFLNFVPLKFRRTISLMIRKLDYSSLLKMEKFINYFLTSEKKILQLDKKINKLATLLETKNDLSEIYFNMLSTWPNNLTTYKDLNISEIINQRNIDEDMTNSLMDLDINNYMHDDILTKVDRSAMNFSLETRIPYLDNEVFEFSRNFKIEEKINHGVGKIPLRKILSKYLDSEFYQQPKMGFGIPLNLWLRTDLKDWAYDILKSKNYILEDMVDVKNVMLTWEKHLKGENHGEYIWNTLILINWLISQK